MKVENKNFYLSEYEEEEEYLRKMANKGYELVALQHRFITVGYRFKEIEPKDLVYRLDFYTGNDEAQYIQMYEDYGWSYVAKLNNFYYFKKEGTEADLEIFSDNESRYGMVRKIIISKLIPICLCGVCSLGIGIMLLDPFSTLGIFYYGLILILLYSIFRCIKGFYKLEKKYGGK